MEHIMSMGQKPSRLRYKDEEDRQWKEQMVAKLELQEKQITNLLNMVSKLVSAPQATEPTFSAPATISELNREAVGVEPIGAVGSTLTWVALKPPLRSSCRKNTQNRKRCIRKSKMKATFGGYTIPNVAWSLPAIPDGTTAISPQLPATQDHLRSFEHKRLVKKRLKRMKRKRLRGSAMPSGVMNLPSTSVGTTVMPPTLAVIQGSTAIPPLLSQQLVGGGKRSYEICYQCGQLRHTWINCDNAPVPFMGSETQGASREEPIATVESDHEPRRVHVRAATRKRPRCWVRWDFPDIGWVKLNVDGASKGNPGLASFGGVMRDERGCWLFGYMGHIGVASNIVAELWAIREGLKLAWNRGFRNILLESDSQMAVQLLRCEIDEWHPLALLVKDCLELLKLGWYIRPQHVLREGNQAADHLANMGAALGDQDLVVLDVPPSSLGSILTADASGVLYER